MKRDRTWTFRLPLLAWVCEWYARDCAMRGALCARTPWGCLVLMPPAWDLPRAQRTGRWRWYAYLSPNSTPWAATWAVGPGLSAAEKRKARVRRALWGHGYDCNRLDPQMLDVAVDVVELRTDHSLARLQGIFRQRAGWTAEAACSVH